MRIIPGLILLAVVICLTISVSAAAASTPQKISYQGRATDASGNPVPDGSYPVEFYIYPASTLGAALWSETGITVTTSNGLFTHLLGSHSDFSDILFTFYDSLFLEVKFNGQTQTPRTPLVSVPYAMRVNTVDHAIGGNIQGGTEDNVLTLTGRSPFSRTGLYSTVGGTTTDSVKSIDVVARNTQGPVFGGYLTSQSDLSGVSYGVYARGRGLEAGNVLGGEFLADANGTGSFHTGVRGTAYASAGTHSFGGEFFATTIDGTAHGIRCEAISQTSGAYGIAVAAQSTGGSASTYGIKTNVYSQTPHTGTVYGGRFENWAPTGTAYGLSAEVSGSSNSNSSYGIHATCEHGGAGTGTSYAGYFLADSTGTGASYGARPVGLSRGSATACGTSSVAANQGTGTVYGGYFEAYNYGTGTKYGIYAKAPSSGNAGYFSGNIYVTGNSTVAGTKSAAVEIEPETYRLVYSQESPECWFEDFGRGQLQNGRVHIELDPMFLKTVTVDQQHPMNVFIQLNDPNCNGTAVICGTTGFDVVELLNGAGNATFTYRVVAKRKGYEDTRLGIMSGLPSAQVEASQAADRAMHDQAERAHKEVAAKERIEREKLEAERSQRGLVDNLRNQ